LDPKILAQVLRHLPKPTDANIIIGLDTSDDAAVYRLNKDQAIIQTLDFFTPMVDDPYLFGQVAAANSLSDVYAMGGIPVLALNIVCFPNCLSPDILQEILRGGSEKVLEAGASTVGGHSVEDDEPKYGLSVTGLVNPEKVWANQGAKPGDVLILTKPLGSGILSTAIKADLLSPKMIGKTIDWMRLLNKYAAEPAQLRVISAATDITGFGFIGHAVEMIQKSSIDLKVNTKAIPIMEGAQEMAEMGIIPAGAYRNKKHVEDHVHYQPEIPLWLQDIVSDPQTSGGLLIALSSDEWVKLKSDYDRLEIFYAEVGKVFAGTGQLYFE
jgi:selenide,water dikinase